MNTQKLHTNKLLILRNQGLICAGTVRYGIPDLFCGRYAVPFLVITMEICYAFVKFKIPQMQMHFSGSKCTKTYCRWGSLRCSWIPSRLGGRHPSHLPPHRHLDWQYRHFFCTN